MDEFMDEFIENLKVQIKENPNIINQYKINCMIDNDYLISYIVINEYVFYDYRGFGVTVKPHKFIDITDIFFKHFDTFSNIKQLQDERNHYRIMLINNKHYVVCEYAFAQRVKIYKENNINV